MLCRNRSVAMEDDEGAAFPLRMQSLFANGCVRVVLYADYVLENRTGTQVGRH